MPGHEVIGLVDAVGANVRGWSIGQRVGVGWHGGNCGYCDTCRRGDAFACETETLVTGVTSDGGYADYMIAPAEALAQGARRIVGGRGSAADVRRHHDVQRPAQQRCAPGRYRRGTWASAGSAISACSSRRSSASRPSRSPAVQDKAPLARQLGAHHYIDNAAEDPAAALQKLGGAKAILATATSAEAMNSVQGGLASTAL